MQYRGRDWVCGGGLLLLAGCVAAPPAPPVTRVSSTAEPASHSIAGQVWGLQPTDPMPALEVGDAARLAAGQDPEKPVEPAVGAPDAAGSETAESPAQEGEGQGQDAETRAAIRARFGSGVLIGADGTVTKRYYLSGEAGEVLLNLLAEPEAAAPKLEAGSSKRLQAGGSEHGQSILGRMLGDQEVELIYISGFETPDSIPIKSPVTGAAPPPAKAKPNDLLLVKSGAAGLGAFEDALNLFFADVPQVEIEVKVVEYSTVDSLNFGIIPIDGDTPTFRNLGSNQLIRNITSQFPLVAPISGGANVADQGIITLGGIHDSWELNATLQALATNNVADILSSPKLVVRNGGLATVTTETEIPYPKAKITASGQNVTADIQFKSAGITLNIRPVIAGTQTVILQLYAKVSAVTSFAATDPVPTPIISTREVVSSVHVTDGRTTVIGGLVTDTTFDRELKIPLLGDIPILGYLFRSTSTQKSRTTLEFHITPRILQGQGGVSAAPVGG